MVGPHNVFSHPLLDPGIILHSAGEKNKETCYHILLTTGGNHPPPVYEGGRSLFRGLGVDLVEIEHVARVGVERLVPRLLTEREQFYLPVGSSLRLLEYVAGRFAAKEAIAKAIGTGISACLRFHDMEVLPTSGAPRVVLSVSSQKSLFAVMPITIHLSITHTRQHALAAAVIWQEGATDGET